MRVGWLITLVLVIAATMLPIAIEQAQAQEAQGEQAENCSLPEGWDPAEDLPRIFTEHQRWAEQWAANEWSEEWARKFPQGRANLCNASLVGALTVSAKSAQDVAYQTAGDCDGLPRVNVVTAPGFCVGLLAQGFSYPRGIVALPDGALLLADMGSWTQPKGSLWRLSPSAQGWQRTNVMGGLDRPNGLVVGPDQRVYVGEATRIFRFDPADPDHTREDVIGGVSGVEAPPGTGRHPMSAFVFDAQGDLIVNIGSASDNCETDAGPPDASKPCPEAEGRTPRGSLRRYRIMWPQGQITGWETFARGLRNSMAMVVHPTSGILLQGENSRDFIDHADASLDAARLPHDELNLIRAGASYGWPYCYDVDIPSPEYPTANCSLHEPPIWLLPAHSSPLALTYYLSPGAPEAWHGHLLVALHGYQETGHRLIAFQTDPEGIPVGPPVELISAWEARLAGVTGSPTSLTVLPDGSIAISEDRNGTVLRLSPRSAASHWPF